MRCEVNARRGFFRLWIVFCVLVVLGVIIASYSEVHDEFAETNIRRIVIKNLQASMLPVNCVDPVPRGSAGADYSVSAGLCWYKVSDFRRLYPEYSDFSESVLSDKLKAKNIRWQSPAHPWRTMLGLAEGTIVLLLTVFVMGYALIWMSAWVSAGFRSRPG